MSATTVALSPFWSDDFDMDLPRVLPDVWAEIQKAPTVPLYTWGHTTHGRLNHPNVWNDYDGTVAFVGFDPACGKPRHYVGGGEIVECTFAELLRDEWAHDYWILLEGRRLVAPTDFNRDFAPLMYDLRGWTPLRPERKAVIERRVASRMRRACREFSAIVNTR